MIVCKNCAKSWFINCKIYDSALLFQLFFKPQKLIIFNIAGANSNYVTGYICEKGELIQL